MLANLRKEPLTADQAAAFVRDHFSLKHGLAHWNLRLEVTKGCGFVEIAVVMPVPDRNTGEINDVQVAEVFGTFTSRMTEEMLAARVRLLLQRALTHEVDEGLHVRGVRVFDPHYRTPGITEPARPHFDLRTIEPPLRIRDD